MLTNFGTILAVSTNVYGSTLETILRFYFSEKPTETGPPVGKYFSHYVLIGAHNESMHVYLSRNKVKSHGDRQFVLSEPFLAFSSLKSL